LYVFYDRSAFLAHRRDFSNRYLEHSSSHLDVGSETGYFPSRPSTIPLLNKLKRLTFIDTDPNTLSTAAQQTVAAGYKGPAIDLRVHNVLRPLPASVRGQFDTISAFNIFQKLDGRFPLKASHLAATLLPALVPGPDSTLYGTTILGRGVSHSWIGRLVLRWLNSHGIFGNFDDSADSLRAGLAPYFDEVEIEVVGRMALFVCRGPRSQNLR
jgi:hypothetical protein